MALLSGEFLRLPEVRIVLLGWKYGGKSSAGNTILGKKEFKLKESIRCQSRQGEVAGRKVTVVKAPGWWRDIKRKYTPKLVEQEIVLSASICPPGPHAVLVVLDLGCQFLYKKSLAKHIQLLGERVWNHAIVLFTFGDDLRGRSIEQYVHSEGEAFQWLIAQCGNRYHVFNNKDWDDCSQVTELLEKIDKMVAGNAMKYYQLDSKIKEEIENKRTEENKRAEKRLMQVQKRREMLRSMEGVSLDLPEQRMVLLGCKEAGKSSSGNTILGRKEFTSAAQCESRQAEVAGRKVTVVDTPGWIVNCTIENTTELTKQEIRRSVSLCPPGPHALLLVMPVDVSFTDKTPVEQHLHRLGDSVLDHTIILFTYAGILGNITIEQYIESEGEAIQWLVEKCGNRYHVFNNKKKDDGAQVIELLEKIEEMVSGNGGRCCEIQSPPKPLLPHRRAQSKDFTPFMSHENLETTWSLRSSGQGSSHCSEISSVFGSMRSSSSGHSSGFGSLKFILESKRSSESRQKKVLSFFTKGSHSVTESGPQHPDRRVSRHWWGPRRKKLFGQSESHTMP